MFFSSSQFLLLLLNLVFSGSKLTTSLFQLLTGSCDFLFSLLCLLLFNIPTIWTYFVYRRTRKKLGREAWPFRGKPAGSDDKKTK